MLNLTFSIDENIKIIDKALNVGKSFDLIKRELEINSKKVVMYYVDGFVTAPIMQKLMMHLTTIKDFGENKEGDVEKFVKTSIPSVEVDVCYSLDKMITMVLSGCTLMIADGFGNGAIIIDARTYPARITEEPENDKVMRGARDGFVETLLFNIAMVRRRIRNPNLVVEYHSIGEDSKTDVSLIYLEGKDPDNYVSFNGEEWRIIGLFEGSTIGLESGKQYTKIIRNTPMYKAWDDNENDWANSTLKAYLKTAEMLSFFM